MACPKNLVCLEISDLQLAFKTSPGRQRNMKQNRPIAAHSKIQRGLIAAWTNLAFGKRRTHPWVRHIAFKRNVRSSDRRPISSSQRNRKGVSAK